MRVGTCIFLSAVGDFPNPSCPVLDVCAGKPFTLDFRRVEQCPAPPASTRPGRIECRGSSPGGLDSSTNNPTPADAAEHTPGAAAVRSQQPAASADILSAYVNTYLKEELQAEGFIRNVPPFVRFLAVAGQLNGQVVNAQNIAREAAVARSTVDTYFAVLSDTLVGHILPAWRPGLKVREPRSRNSTGSTRVSPGLRPVCCGIPPTGAGRALRLKP